MRPADSTTAAIAPAAQLSLPLAPTTIPDAFALHLTLLRWFSLPSPSALPEDGTAPRSV